MRTAERLQPYERPMSLHELDKLQERSRELAEEDFDQVSQRAWDWMMDQVSIQVADAWIRAAWSNSDDKERLLSRLRDEYASYYAGEFWLAAYHELYGDRR